MNILNSHSKFDLNTPLLPPDSRLTSYTGDQIAVQGKVHLECSYKCRTVHTVFYIVDQSNVPALSNLQTTCDLGLIQVTYAIENHEGLDKDTVLSEFNDLFHGIGLFEGTCSIQLKQNAVPALFALRERCPLHYKINSSQNYKQWRTKVS